MICDLPFEIQNKIFYYLEHPCARMIKAFQPTFVRYATIGTCDKCGKHGRKLNLDILAEYGSDTCICISCDNYSDHYFLEGYSRLRFLVDNEIVNDENHSYDSYDDSSDEDDSHDDDDDDYM